MSELIYNIRVPIPLKPGSKEVSLPPFHTPPDKWISQGVVEPLRSPWGALDFRRLNVIIPNENPLPKREDILQALVPLSQIYSDGDRA